MEFLETIESLRAGDASVQALFGGEGRRARSGDPRNARYGLQLAEAASFLADVLGGRRPVYHLREALTTSDFPLLFADILDRQVLAAYREVAPTWPAIAKRTTVRDFRSVKMYPPAYGLDTRLGVVGQLQEYPEATLNEQAALTMSVVKYGRRIGFAWEAIINDDLEQLMGIPERFAKAARRTEQRFATELFVDASGPHATMFAAGNHNVINTTNGASATNPPLSISGLQDAFKVLAAQVDESGEPISLEMLTLVVPPALEVTARNILNALQIELTTAGGVRDGGSGEQRLIAQNWMRNQLNLVVDPYIPLTATTANGSTSWFLFANPTTGRPALVMAFLRGHEEPEIWIKEPNARKAGGGGVDPMDGDFDTDAVTYRVRHVLGGLRIDPKAAASSNGSGS